MTKQEIHEKVTKVIPYIIEYNNTRSVGHYTEDIINTIIDLYETELVKAPVGRGCPSCLKFPSDVIYSYYEREMGNIIVPDVKVNEESKKQLDEVLKNIEEAAVIKPKKANSRTKK